MADGDRLRMMMHSGVTTNMQCPIDRVELQQREISGRNVFSCAQCHGHYVPAELFPEARAASAVQLHLQQKQAFSVLRRDGLTLISPCHAKTMQTLFFRGIEIDVCPECLGLWLDDGELQKIKEQVSVAKKENLSDLPVEKPTVVAGSAQSASYDALDAVVEVVDIFSWFAD